MFFAYANDKFAVASTAHCFTALKWSLEMFLDFENYISSALAVILAIYMLWLVSSTASFEHG